MGVLPWRGQRMVGISRSSSFPACLVNSKRRTSRIRPSVKEVTSTSSTQVTWPYHIFYDGDLDSYYCQLWCVVILDVLVGLRVWLDVNCDR